MYVNESSYFFLDCGRCSTKNVICIVLTYIFKKVGSVLIAPNKLNICIKIRRLLTLQQ